MPERDGKSQRAVSIGQMGMRRQCPGKDVHTCNEGRLVRTLGTLVAGTGCERSRPHSTSRPCDRSLRTSPLVAVTA